jgi:GxxExxY protein
MRLGVVNILSIQVLYQIPKSICAVPGSLKGGSKVNTVTSGWPTWSHLNTSEFLDVQMLSNLRRSMSHSTHSPLNTLVKYHVDPTLSNSVATPGLSMNPSWSPMVQESVESALSMPPEQDRSSGEVEVLTAVANTVGSVRYRAVDVHEAMCSIIRDVYRRCGGGYTESFYQRAVLRAAYLQGLPVMMERDLFADFGGGSLLAGRVDLEVAGVCLYELKVGSPKIPVDSKQVKKYLKAYDVNKEDIQIASLVYFGTGHVFIHNVRERIDSGRSAST